MIIKLKNQNLIIDTPNTFLISDTASGVTSLVVKNISGFLDKQILIIGGLGNEGSEIVSINGSPTGSTITTLAATKFPHSAGTSVNVIQYDQVEFSNATTITGSKTVLDTISLQADSQSTNYISTTVTGYFFGRFKNSIDSSFSSYSDPISATGYSILSARSIIDNAVEQINKKITSDGPLTDDYCFKQLNNCQTEVLRELKRWSFMQEFDYNLGELDEGQWKLALPTDIDDQNTNKSIYNIRFGTDTNLTWVDKQKWNELLQGAAYTTLATNIAVSDVAIVLTDSSNFADAGTLKIGANEYSYTANNRTTNTLTITASTTTNTAGEDAFQFATTGRPRYWTTFDGYLYVYPIVDSQFDQRNILMDYYKTVTQITQDTDTIIFPDPTVAQYYLSWKCMLRTQNGDESNASLAMKGNYLTRLQKMKDKETMNRTFCLKPTLNKIDISNNIDDKNTRIGNFI